MIDIKAHKDKEAIIFDVKAILPKKVVDARL